MVEWLLGDELNQSFRQQQLTAAASGNFFQVYVLFKNRNSYRKFFFYRGRPCYYGETPLAFACCTNQWNIAEILLKYGASMDAVCY
jgi:hypothetical protein